MADTKISGFTAAGSANDTDELVANQAGTTRKLTVAQVKSGLAPASHTHAAGDVNSGVLAHERGGLEADVSAYDGLIKIAGGATGNIKCNFAGASAPTVNDDSIAGYSIGSRWYDLTADKEYVCLDATGGAAVWIETTQSSSGLAVPAFRAYNSVTQALAAGTWVKMSLDTVDIDSHSGVSLANNNYVVSENGVYFFAARWSWGAGSKPSDVYAALAVDTTWLAMSRTNIQADVTAGSFQVWTICACTAGQIVDVWGNSSVATTAAGGVAGRVFEGFKIRD